MCVYVLYSPTPLAPITPTHNPNVTQSVTQSVTHRAVNTHRCTHTHKVPTLGIFAPRRPGKPDVRVRPCLCPCVVVICLIRGSSCWLHIWPGSSSQAELPHCPLGSLELWEAQRGSGKVATPHDLRLSPEGDRVLVSQWEWCHIAAQTRRLTNVTAVVPSDWWCMSRWVRTSFNLRWECTFLLFFSGVQVRLTIMVF